MHFSRGSLNQFGRCTKRLSSVGIVGLGKIGSAIAKRAEAFNCSISYHSRSKKPNTKYKYYSNTKPT
ncbi:hypothetical protein V6Z12_A09G084600 [Gossypium hirsutum]